MPAIKNKIALALATGFGLGYLPIAPGSWGSLGMVLVAWWLLKLPIYGYLLIGLIILLIGGWSIRLADPLLAEKTKKSHDNKNIVIDEWLGQLITLLPLYYFKPTWLALAAGLFLFRAFDTAKFGLAKYFDKSTSYWGVILDDLFAGLHAALVFFLLLWVLHHTGLPPQVVSLI